MKINHRNNNDSIILCLSLFFFVSLVISPNIFMAHPSTNKLSFVPVIISRALENECVWCETQCEQPD